jgi:hypothetical protein
MSSSGRKVAQFGLFLPLSDWPEATSLTKRLYSSRVLVYSETVHIVFFPLVYVFWGLVHGR